MGSTDSTVFKPKRILKGPTTWSGQVSWAFAYSLILCSIPCVLAYWVLMCVALAYPWVTHFTRSDLYAMLSIVVCVGGSTGVAAFFGLRRGGVTIKTFGYGFPVTSLELNEWKISRRSFVVTYASAILISVVLPMLLFQGTYDGGASWMLCALLGLVYGLVSRWPRYPVLFTFAFMTGFFAGLFATLNDDPSKRSWFTPFLEGMVGVGFVFITAGPLVMTMREWKRGRFLKRLAESTPL